MDYLKTLFELCKESAVSGFEENFSKILKGKFSDYSEKVVVDKFFNVISYKNCRDNKSLGNIMLTAHIDEIGIMVKNIDKNGFIKFTNIGGVDLKILNATEVMIHGKNIKGVIGAKPPHLSSNRTRLRGKEIDWLYIDTGYSESEIRKYVSIGDVVTFDVESIELKETRVAAKSIDNRAGVCCLLGVLDELNKYNFKNNVITALTTMEETTMAGIINTSYNIRPDIVIVVDVVHGDMPGAPKDEIFKLGKGTAIAVGPNLNTELTNKLIKIADMENHNYQIDVEPGNTGTEAWAAQVSRCGIPTLLLSIPLRYMHTPYEVVDINDVKNTSKLIAKFISSLEREVD